MGINAALLDERLTVLRRSLEADLIGRFRAYLADQPDDELFRMNPWRFASRTGMNRDRVLDLFVHATKAGILEFSWGVVCPGCMAFLSTAAALASLTVGKDCKL